jgi:hypothetical protein
MTLGRRARVALICAFFAALASIMVPGVVVSTVTEGVNAPLLAAFKERMPDNPVIYSVAHDLNGDGMDDLVVIYNIAQDVNRMLVVFAGAGESDVPVFTNALPAPVSNQVIQFMDIDERPPMEFIVYGSKGLNTGFAIYRCHGDTVEDLFGDKMHECCN